jgi:mycothiol synthase
MHHVDIISRLDEDRSQQLTELLAAAARADGHDPVGEHKFLRLQQGDDLTLGMVALESGCLAGYAHTLTFGESESRRVSCELVVHPGFRRRGVGSRLIERVITHAESQGARRLDFWAYNDSPASRHVARRFGLTESRRLLHMHRHPGRPPQLPPPDAASIRSFRPGEEHELLRLNNVIFRGHPENGEWTLEDIQARMQQPWFRPDDLLILEAGGRPAGFCWLKVEERGQEGMVGEVYVIGTMPEYQGRGLGRYLLSQALLHLHRRDVDAVAVYVDQSNIRAVALYWSLGFHHHHVDVCYSLPLPAERVWQQREAAAG